MFAPYELICAQAASLSSEASRSASTSGAHASSASCLWSGELHHPAIRTPLRRNATSGTLPRPTSLRSLSAHPISRLVALPSMLPAYALPLAAVLVIVVFGVAHAAPRRVPKSNELTQCVDRPGDKG